MAMICGFHKLVFPNRSWLNQIQYDSLTSLCSMGGKAPNAKLKSEFRVAGFAIPYYHIFTIHNTSLS